MMQIIDKGIVFYDGDKYTKVDDEWYRTNSETELIPLTPWYNYEIENLYQKIINREKKLKRICEDEN